MGETGRDYSSDRGKDPAAAELALDLVEATPKLSDEFIQGRKLNG